ncbi:MAG: PQQ-binding-like beta-propeller repeat protein, partial [Spirochaetia bacterium]|nr:PQQ-binding-like beta-propeller repeat protein [Spirochaetia bacterium]
FNPPVVKGDSIYFGSIDGNFYALDVTSGYMRWSFAAKNMVNSVPYADDDRVYFGANDGNVYAVAQSDGRLLWTFPTGDPVQSLVLRYKDTVIFTSDTGATFFVTPDGQEQNRIPNPVWSHHTFQVYDNVLYWAPLGRKFGAYDMKTRNFLWTVDASSPYPIWYSFAALDDKRVYYASSFYKYGPVELTYYALDRKNGELLWQDKHDLDVGPNTLNTRDNTFYKHVMLLDYMAPSLYGDKVIYTSGDINVRAYYAKSGKVAWTRKLDYPTSSAPTVAGDRLYFGVAGNEDDKKKKPRLMCLSADSGKTLWEMDTEGAILSAPVISGKRMIFGTDRNIFYVLEEIF